MGTPRAGRTGWRGAELTVVTVPTRLAARQIAALRGKPRASFLLAADDIHRRGCAAAGLRLTGAGLSAICRLDLSLGESVSADLCGPWHQRARRPPHQACLL